MRIAFFGTPEFAVPALAELAARHEVACIYSQPPRPRGRGQALKPSPVQALAEQLGLPVRSPPSMRDPRQIEGLQDMRLDLAVVVAFGQVLPREVLDAPRLGALNLHGSLLPRWRGAAPIQRALMAGDQITGVQVMRMTEGLDEGPILLWETLRIFPSDTAGTLSERMAAAGARLLPATLAALEAGEASETPQAGEGVTYAKKIRPEETRIDWRLPAVEVDRRIRGLSPAPGAWFMAQGERPTRIKALLSRPEEGAGAPGEVLDDGLLVACGEGAVRLLQAQREGKAAQSAEAFVRGFPIPTGTRLA